MQKMKLSTDFIDTWKGVLESLSNGIFYVDPVQDVFIFLS